MKTDGSKDDMIGWDFCTDGNWIYFSNQADKDYLYKVALDGTDKMKMQEDSSMFVNIADHWIYYYERYSCDSFKVLNNNTNRTKIN